MLGHPAHHQEKPVSKKIAIQIIDQHYCPSPQGGEKIGLRGGGPLGIHFPTPPPTIGSQICLLTMPGGGGGGGLRGRQWGGGVGGCPNLYPSK